MWLVFNANDIGALQVLGVLKNTGAYILRYGSSLFFVFDVLDEDDLFFQYVSGYQVCAHRLAVLSLVSLAIVLVLDLLQ